MCITEEGDEMTDFDSKITALTDERNALCLERDVFTDKIVKLSNKIEKLCEQKEKEKMKQPMTPVEEMEYFLFEDGCVSGARYKAREKFWQDKGFWHSGYLPDVEQINLQMMLYKGEKDNLEKTITSLEEVLPLLKVNAHGLKRLDIFEHTCSEHGSYSVEITDKSYDLIVHRYHRKSTVKSFDNLRSLVEYVQEHHYYESSIDSDESDYDD